MIKENKGLVGVVSVWYKESPDSVNILYRASSLEGNSAVLREAVRSAKKIVNAQKGFIAWVQAIQGNFQITIYKAERREN